MLYLVTILFAYLASPSIAYGQSQLLESVKNNPEEAKALCNEFRRKNSIGLSSRSKDVIEGISQAKNLSFTDAEILSIYVIGMHCPDVK